MHAAIVLQQPAVVAALVIFYFVADIHTCAINTEIYFTAVYILFYCVKPWAKPAVVRP